MHHSRTHDPPLSSRVALVATVALAATAGCYAHDGYGYGYTTVQPQATYVAPQAHAQIDTEISAPGVTPAVEVGVSTPQLVSVNPQVQVVADYHEPIFYTGGLYWREYNGGWYRSRNYSSGWTYDVGVPYSVRNIENRHSYRNYRPAGYVRGYNSYRRHEQPIVRGNYGHYDRGYRQPVTRDYRGGHDRGYRQPVTTRDYRGRNNGSSYRQRPVTRDHRGGRDRNYRRR